MAQQSYGDPMAGEHPWRAPAWDSADGGALSRLRLIEKQREIQTGEAEAWIMNKKAAPSTPTTEASTPSPPPKNATIPLVYQKTISSAFGLNADLYELLEVDRDASDRDIRIAYFRRGRQVLTDTTGPSNSASMSIGCVSEDAKLRFQAVSMAYEILSNPAWRASYEKTGLGRHDEAMIYSDSRSVPSSPVSDSDYGKRTGVRWNEEVEELVFDQDPSEFSMQGSEYGVCGDDERAPRESKKKKKKKKRVVVEDSGELLEDHLAKLDEVADRDLFNDFWDDLEASIDGLLSLGSRGSKGSRSSSKSSSENVTPVNPSAAPETTTKRPTRSPPPIPEARPPVATKEQSVTSNPSTPPRDSSFVHPPKDRSPDALHERKVYEQMKKSHERSPRRSKRLPDDQDSLPRNIVINPEDREVQPPSNIAFKSKHKLAAPSPDFSENPAGYDTTDETTISTISSTTFGMRKQQQPPPSLLDPPDLEKVSDPIFPDVLPDTSDDPVRDVPLNENENDPDTNPEWLSKSRQPLLDTDGENATAITKASDASTVATSDVDFCKTWCADNDSAQDGTSGPVAIKKDESGGFVSDFFYHLYSYVQAMANDVSKFGRSVSEDPPSILKGILLEDDDLDDFFCILRTELNRSPHDLNRKGRK